MSSHDFYISKSFSKYGQTPLNTGNIGKYRESQISSKIRILANTTQTTL